MSGNVADAASKFDEAADIGERFGDADLMQFRAGNQLHPDFSGHYGIRLII